MRVFELAKKIGIPTKEMMALLKRLGIKASNHMAALEESDIQTVMKGMDKSGTVKVASKGTKSAKVAAPPPAPVAEKKSRVLIKKRPTPEELAAMAAPLVTEEIPVDGIGKELPSGPVNEQAPAAAALTAPEAAVPSVSTEEVKSAPPLSPIAEPLAAAAEVAKVISPDGAKKEETADKKGDKDKKKGKIEPRTEVKKDAAAKFKDKAKRPKQRERWDPQVVVEEVETVAEVPVEARKWQDFKPIHRKEDRKGVRRGLAVTAEITKPRRKVVKLYEGMTVKEFSELIGQKVPSIIAKLMVMGKMATINQPISLDEASLISEEFGVKAEMVSEKTEEEILNQPASEDPDTLLPRPPVITIMGHVDHGKTSLLDAIRQTKVTEGEAGGITQHIGAYTVTVGEKRVTFLDTPGHEAFTAMRARGAKVTDIVVLVVAADDGVMPQTVEAINHAKAAGVPIIVAVNKIDKPEANAERVKTALSEYELIPEAWGGKTIFAEVSAKKKIGLEGLLEMILLQAEVLELKANPNRPMAGTIVEAKLDRGRGPVATVLVQQGTLRVGDAFVTGTHFGKVRALINDKGQKVDEAGPSMPVEVIGLDGVPLAGDTFVVVTDDRVAKDVAHSRSQRQRLVELSQSHRVTLDDLYQEIQQGIVKELNIIVKADVQGSTEAIKESLEKLSSPLVKLRVIHRGVGGITESDVLLASASNAIVIGFNVRPEAKGQELAEREKVDIRLYTIIYDAIADVKAAMEGLLEPTLKERTLGRVDVRQVFQIPKQGFIAGGYVSSGTVSRSSAGARVLRDGVVVYEGKVGSLRRFKDDVKEVQTGYECGIGVENFNDLKVGDVIEVYTYDKIAGKL
ncbi:MAG: translation initiation factor IF-2 [Nitrospirae bacterium]|nr:translation initiation factor IF-2 [Candidatus Manganitrophaceae bacterium]